VHLIKFIQNRNQIFLINCCNIVMLICFNKVTACVMNWMKYNKEGVGGGSWCEVSEGERGALSLQDIYI
jgi:hypothetical protein